MHWPAFFILFFYWDTLFVLGGRHDGQTPLYEYIFGGTDGVQNIFSTNSAPIVTIHIFSYDWFFDLIVCLISIPAVQFLEGFLVFFYSTFFLLQIL